MIFDLSGWFNFSKKVAVRRSLHQHQITSFTKYQLITICSKLLNSTVTESKPSWLISFILLQVLVPVSDHIKLHTTQRMIYQIICHIGFELITWHRIFLKMEQKLKNHLVEKEFIKLVLILDYLKINKNQIRPDEVVQTVINAEY